MKKISGFDLGVGIAFLVIALLGGTAWWILSGNLQTAQAAVAAAKTDFDRYSVAKEGQESIIVSRSNQKTLQANIDLIKAQLSPLIQSRLQSKDNKLSSIDKEDPVAWKHDLDDEVQGLTAAAKVHGVALPVSFYFGFSRYLSQSPNDEQTAVLSKQLLGVEQIATILINAPVKRIAAIRRTYEEDPHTDSGNSSPPSNSQVPMDHLNGYSLNDAGNAYTAYPFEVEFEANTENFRTVIDTLIQSPYVFVVRTINVENSSPNSPLLNDLDRMAGTPSSSVVDSSPGEVAATTSTKGPQFLFGSSTLTVKARIDMIEWTGGDLAETNAPTAMDPRHKPSSPAGNR
jgi:hypothetical protein